MATLKAGTTVDGSLVHTHKTLPILIIDGNLTHGGAVVFDTKNRPSFKSLTDNVIDVRTDSVIINTSKGNTSATIYDNGVFELKKAHVPYFSVEATGNIIGKIEWSRVQSKPIVGTTGTSTTNIMHQKAVSDAIDKKMDHGAYGLGQDPKNFTRDDYGNDANDYIVNGSYGLSRTSVKPQNNFPISAGDGGMLVFGDFHNKVQLFNGGGSALYWRMNNTDNTTSWEKWNQLATKEELDKVNDGIKNRLIKDGGKLITTGSAETLLDKVPLGDYNQYMFTNNNYLGMSTTTNFYIQTMEANDQSIVQVGYPIMTQRAMERKVNNRLIFRNRSPWRDTTNTIKRHDWSDWSTTLVHQDLTKTINTNVANASDENIPTEKAVRTELNKKIDGGSVVQTIGTSTVNVMSQKAIRDYTDSVGNTTGKFMREGAYGLGTRGEVLAIANEDVKSGFYTAPSPNKQEEYPDWMRLGDGLIKVQYSATHSNLLAIGTTYSRSAFGYMRGGIVNWSEILTDSNTTTDKNNVLHSGTTVVKDTMVVGDFGIGQTLTNFTRNDFGSDANEYTTNGSYGLGIGAITVENNFPITTGDGALLVFGDYHNKVQIFNGTAGRIYWRMNNVNNTTSWEEWRQFYHDSNTTTDKSGFLRASGSATALTTAQNLKDLANVTTARTNLGLGNSAIRNLTTAQGTSDTLVATQKLVNDVKLGLNTEIGKKLTAGNLVQTTGTSTTNVMSQKAVTDAIAKSLEVKTVILAQEAKNWTWVNETKKTVLIQFTFMWDTGAGGISAKYWNDDSDNRAGFSVPYRSGDKGTKSAMVYHGVGIGQKLTLSFGSGASNQRARYIRAIY